MVLSQRRTNGCMNVISSLEMKVLQTSVDNEATLKSDVIATLCHLTKSKTGNVVAALQS